MIWTTEQVVDFAPDASTAESGQALASKRKWLKLAGNERYLWGEFKTRKGDNYQCVIELKSPTFQCSCRSNKSPCKHIVGLLHLLAEGSDAILVSEELPVWAKAQLHNLPKGEIEKTPEEKAAAKAFNAAQKERNRSKRMMQMEQGLEELETWLLDLMRQGLASTEAQGDTFWKAISTRLVDAKLGGIARQVRVLTEIYSSGLEWPEIMLDTLAHIYLLVKGFKQLDQLPESLQKDMLSVLGININKNDLLPLKGIRDDWAILGQLHGREEKINFRRTWIEGLQSRQKGLILEFAWGDSGYMTNWPVGKIFSGELIFYPSNFQQRVYVKDHSPPFADVGSFPAYPNFEAALKDFAKALGQNPWLFNFPMAIESAIPVMYQKQLLLIDQNKQQIPVEKSQSDIWKLLAISGGNPITIFGEWTGSIFVSLSVWSEGRLINL